MKKYSIPSGIAPSFVPSTRGRRMNVSVWIIGFCILLFLAMLSYFYYYRLWHIGIYTMQSLVGIRDPQCYHSDMCYVDDTGGCHLKHPEVMMPTTMICDEDYSRFPEYGIRSVQQQPDGTYLTTFENYLCADGHVEKPQGPTCIPTNLVRIVDYVGRYGTTYSFESEDIQRYVRFEVDAGYYYYTDENVDITPDDVWLDKSVIDELLLFAEYVHTDGRCGKLVITYGYRSYELQKTIGDLREPRGSSHQAGNTVDVVCTHGIEDDAIEWMPGYYYLPKDIRDGGKGDVFTAYHDAPGEEFGVFHLIYFDPPHFNIADVKEREVVKKSEK